MARNIIANSSWKTINFRDNMTDESIFENLVEFKELTDYQISTLEKKPKKRKLESELSPAIDKPTKIKANKLNVTDNTIKKHRKNKTENKSIKKPSDCADPTFTTNEPDTKIKNKPLKKQKTNSNKKTNALEGLKDPPISSKAKQNKSDSKHPTAEKPKASPTNCQTTNSSKTTVKKPAFRLHKSTSSDAATSSPQTSTSSKAKHDLDDDDMSSRAGNDDDIDMSSRAGNDDDIDMSSRAGNDDIDMSSRAGNDDDIDMSRWSNLFVPEKVLRALADLNFTEPTPIQSMALPYSIRDGADIIGAAQTGSGKTLAFVIPILYHILNREQVKSRSLHTLIITPTRELAMQIRDHFNAVAKYTDVKCTAIVGGMSIDKQNRLLGYQPEVLVATPGRLWELIEQKHDHLADLESLRCLVIDEADRLVQQGHFKELTQILNVVNNNEVAKLKRQNFIYSATLTFVHDKPKRTNPKKMKKMKEVTMDQKLETITNLIGLRDNRRLIDLSTPNQMTERLVEYQIRCTFDQKDIHLFYLIKYLPCRRLVFANSKDAVRRVGNILGVLGCLVYPLHADMHQKQRLKNLDKFKANENSVLLATDVAARGLDIDNIQQVVHYHVPKTTENYVHRSGRTARSDKGGSSIIFVSPEEQQAFKKIIISLKKTNDLDHLPFNLENFTKCKSIVQLAIQIEKEEHHVSKFDAKMRWFKQAAAEADLESENNSSSDEEEMLKKTSEKQKLKDMKRELALLLKSKSRKRKKN